MLTADGEKSKSPKRAKVRFLLATLTYICMYISVKMAAPWGSLTLLSFHSLCLHLRSHLTKCEVFQNTSS